jgi:hypothetical protein
LLATEIWRFASGRRQTAESPGNREYETETPTQEFVKETNQLDANPLLLLPVWIMSRKNIELSLNTFAYFSDAQLVVTGSLVHSTLPT